MKLFLIAIALLNGFMYLHYQNSDSAHHYEENSLVENLQALNYALASLILIPAIFKNKGFHKFFLSALALLCLTFFLREVDVERLDVHPLLIALGSGTGRNIILSAGFLGLLVWFLRHHRIGFWGNLPAITSPVFIYTILAGICLFTAEAFEDLRLVFWEESLELSASILILSTAVLSAFCPYLASRRRPTSHKTYAPECDDTLPLP